MTQKVGSLKLFNFKVFYGVRYPRAGQNECSLETEIVCKEHFKKIKLRSFYEETNFIF